MGWATSLTLLAGCFSSKLEIALACRHRALSFLDLLNDASLHSTHKAPQYFTHGF